MKNLKVGPILREGILSDAIAEVIGEQNPSAEIFNNGAYLRVSVPGRCLLSRSEVERRIGRTFNLRTELEQVMFSFVGTLHLTDEEAVWEILEQGEQLL